MNYVKMTKWFIIISTVLISAYDVFAFLSHQDATISETIWNWSAKYPIVPFLGGLLSGHLFFPQYIKNEIS